MERENQRNGRNKNTIINHTYMDSGEYRRKFDKISDNVKLNRLLYYLARVMLEHRSGTLYEDMYWVDLKDIRVVARETESDIEEGIRYSGRTEKVIKTRRQLLTIHSHPHSFPPSIADFNSNFRNQYVVGIIICHNGKIYMYSAEEEISEKYYNLVVEEYIKQGYNECEAQIKTLEELKNKFAIKFKEVTAHDV